MKKIVFASFLTIILLSVSSYGKENYRASLSQISVGKEGNFRYWNQDSPALQQLKSFVATVTDPDSMGYVPPRDRIATIDVDGTLLCETAPYYFHWMLFFHRYLHDDSFTAPEEDRLWAEEVEDYVLKNRKSKSEWCMKQQELQAKGFRGMTDSQFSAYVSDFLASEDVKGLSQLKWGTALYWPMIEAVSYLIANNFVVFICSGTDRDICREVVGDVYGIPSYHIIASDVNLVFEHQSGWAEMASAEDYGYTPGEEIHRGDFLQYNTVANKIVKIRREIGRKPILSWGNSTGDFPMFHYTCTDNAYPHISFCVLCDDTERELGNPEKAAACRKACEQNGWVPVSMKYDWSTIYGPAVAATD